MIRQPFGDVRDLILRQTLRMFPVELASLPRFISLAVSGVDKSLKLYLNIANCLTHNFSDTSHFR